MQRGLAEWAGTSGLCTRFQTEAWRMLQISGLGRKAGCCWCCCTSKLRWRKHVMWAHETSCGWFPEVPWGTFFLHRVSPILMNTVPTVPEWLVVWRCLEYFVELSILILDCSSFTDQHTADTLGMGGWILKEISAMLCDAVDDIEGTISKQPAKQRHYWCWWSIPNVDWSYSARHLEARLREVSFLHSPDEYLSNERGLRHVEEVLGQVPLQR